MGDDNLVSWTDLKTHCKEKQDICRSLEVERRKASAPSTRLTVLSIMAGVAMIAIGGAVYINTNSIRDYDVIARERFVLQTAHKEDITSLRVEIRALADAQTNVGHKLDRNFAIIEKMARK